MGPGRRSKINFPRLRRCLKAAGSNYAAAGRLYGNLSRETVRKHVFKNELLEKSHAFRRGLFKRRVKKYPGLIRNLALRETIFWVRKTRNLKEAAKHLNLPNPDSIYSRLKAVGGVEAILGKEKLIRMPKTTTRIFDRQLKKIALEYPALTRHLSILDAAKQYEKTGSVKEAASALGLKRVTVYGRLRQVTKTIAALKARLPDRILKELNLR